MNMNETSRCGDGVRLFDAGFARVAGLDSAMIRGCQLRLNISFPAARD
jgi:hypothetical protein